MGVVTLDGDKVWFAVTLALPESVVVGGPPSPK